MLLAVVLLALADTVPKRSKLAALLIFLPLSVSSLSVTWCVYRSAELTKCQDLSFGYQGTTLSIECEDFTGNGGAEACWQRVLADTNTITVISAPELYKALRAGTDESFVQVALAEDYDGSSLLTPGSLVHDVWVGVVLGGRSDLRVDKLKNKRICLPSYDSAGSWETAMGYFAWRGWFNPSDRCDPLWTVTRYFGNSCLPDQSSSIPDHWRICAACSRGMCSKETEYAGQRGALKCLLSRAGDVAFVHYKAAKSAESDWGGSYQIEGGDVDTGLKLLCRDKSQTTLDGWAECNFGTARTSALIFNGKLSQGDVSVLQRDLSNPPVNVQHIIFDITKYSASEKTVIFSGETKKLVVMQGLESRDPAVYLGSEYVAHKDALHCISSSSSSHQIAGLFSAGVLVLIALL